MINQIFRIEITEVLKRIVEIEADNIEDALEIVDKNYKSQNIILDSSDFCEFEIKEEDS